jgi:GntR family transcriptional regulator, transcriptional repressor for pyruvate dehydrogenase complex
MLNTHSSPGDLAAATLAAGGSPRAGGEVAAGEVVTPLALRAPIRIPTAVEEITDRLVTAIALGELLPGSRLPPERDMAATLKVGRNTIREAVVRLVAMGIVEIRRGRTGGAVVTASWSGASARAVQRTLLPLRTELEELFDFCALIEATVARAAAERRTDADVRAIQQALAVFVAAPDHAREQAADRMFHGAIMEAAGNPQLAALNRALATRIGLAFPVESWRDPDLGGDGSERARVEHTALSEAIAQGDVEEAGRVARQHSYISAEIIHEALDRADRTLRSSAGAPHDRNIKRQSS